MSQQLKIKKTLFETLFSEMQNSNIRQRLLENEFARCYNSDIRRRKTQIFCRTHVLVAIDKTNFLHSIPDLPNNGNKEESACAASTKSACYFCGFRFHPVQCASNERQSVANQIRKDTNQHVCRSKDSAASKSTTALMISPLLTTSSQNPSINKFKKVFVFLFKSTGKKPLR